MAKTVLARRAAGSAARIKGAMPTCGYQPETDGCRARPKNRSVQVTRMADRTIIHHFVGPNDQPKSARPRVRRGAEADYN